MIQFNSFTSLSPTMIALCLITTFLCLTITSTLLLTTCAYIPQNVKDKTKNVISKVQKSIRKIMKRVKGQSRRLTIDTDVASKAKIIFEHKGKINQVRLSDIEQFMHPVDEHNEQLNNLRRQPSNPSNNLKIGSSTFIPHKLKSNTKLPVKYSTKLRESIFIQKKKDKKPRNKKSPESADRGEESTQSSKPDQSMTTQENKPLSQESSMLYKSEPTTKLQSITTTIPICLKAKVDVNKEKEKLVENQQKVTFDTKGMPVPKRGGGDIGKMFQNLYDDPRIQKILTLPKSNSDDDLDELMTGPRKPDRKYKTR